MRGELPFEEKGVEFVGVEQVEDAGVVLFVYFAEYTVDGEAQLPLDYRCRFLYSFYLFHLFLLLCY